MFDKSTFAHYHSVNANTGFHPAVNRYDGYVRDAEGKPWGYIKEQNLYEQAETGLRVNPAEFQRRNIDVLGYASDGDSQLVIKPPYMASQTLVLRFGDADSSYSEGGKVLSSVGDKILAHDYDGSSAGGGQADWWHSNGLRMRLFAGEYMQRLGPFLTSTTVEENKTSSDFGQNTVYKHSGAAGGADDDKAATCEYFRHFIGTMTLTKNGAAMSGTHDLTGTGTRLNTAGCQQSYSNVDTNISDDISGSPDFAAGAGNNVFEDDYVATLVITQVEAAPSQ
jgi:hypothetical protein